MVDIHCHILPGLDDGAADMDEALVMARVAAQSGSRTIIATPHAGHAEAKASPEAIRAAVKSLQQQVDAAGIDLKLLPGMELLCGSRLERILHNGAYLTLAGSRYLLVEFYFDETLPAIRGMLHSIVEHGLTPVIAHPERYEAVQRDPWVAAAWMEQGYGIQINAGSLLGYLGSDAKRTGKWLVRNGLAQLFGIIWRTGFLLPALKRCFSTIRSGFYRICPCRDTDKRGSFYEKTAKCHHRGLHIDDTALLWRYAPRPVLCG